MNARPHSLPVTLDEQFLAHLCYANRVVAAAEERIKRVQLETLERLASVLLKLGLLSEEVLAAEMATFKRIDRIEGVITPQVSLLGPQLNAGFLRAHELIPVARADEELTIAIWDALDEYAVRALQFAIGTKIRLLVGTRTQILAALDSVTPLESKEIRSAEGDGNLEDEEIDRLKDLASNAPVIRFVQRVIDDAVRRRASDIHLEASEAALHIRFRQDGLLREIETQAKDLAAPVISRIKVMAGLNIAERRLPQDGRIRVTVQGKEIDFRVATSPTLHGESVVLRILDRQDIALDFDALGFDAGLKGLLRSAISRPYGIVLVTGPTGSGKTTTLYAALKEINTPDKKILTVEDPVEYVLQGINQVPIKPQIGLTFAGSLRSFLRQDPDIMMVGEIRDRETAEIAIQAALTGHLLLSTLHTNTAAAAVTRLLDMDIDDYLLTSTLHLIVGQRLLRKLCTHCREPYLPSAEAIYKFGLDTDCTPTWYRPVGCAACQAGYKGRTAIIEALSMTDEVRATILEHADAHQIEQVAVRAGMRTLFRHGIERVNAGTTTMEEVLRVTNLS